MGFARLKLLPSAELTDDFRKILAEEDEVEKPKWRIWIAVGLFTLFWHLLLLWLKPAWQTATVPPRVDIQQIDPAKLDQIRKQWKSRDKQLLIDKDKSKLSDKEAPPNARYMSDKNTKVEKEQRAKVTNVIPKPKSAPPQAKSPPQQKTQTKVGNLGNLGVPFRLSPNPPTPPHEEVQERPESEGGDQALADKTLPEGNENILNTQESIYYSFYARIYDAIGPIWQSRIRDVPGRRQVAQGDYTTTVDIVFDHDGNLVGINHLHDSGIREFDSAVDTSWHRIERFPNPPKGLLDKNGQVHMGWTFTVQVGPEFNIDSRPPSRNY